MQENLTGVRVVRAFGREKYEVERFDQKNDRWAMLWIRLGRLLSAYWGIGDLITGLQILTVICVGVTQAVNGEITLGEFLAFVSYNQSLVWPVRGLGRILSEMSKAGVSIERLAYILDSEPEQEPETVDYGLLAFEWVEANLQALNAQCNEVIGSGKDSFRIPASQLPHGDSWPPICKELLRNGFFAAEPLADGIQVQIKVK